MSYLITGGTGDVGSRVVECLLRRGERLRVFVRNQTKARSRFGDRVDIFVGDLADPGSLRPALEGVDALFLVNTGPQIPALDEAAAKAAKAAGVKHPLMRLGPDYASAPSARAREGTRKLEPEES